GPVSSRVTSVAPPRRPPRDGRPHRHGIPPPPAHPPQPNPHVDVFVRVQTSASADCRPLRTGKNPAIERLESKRGKLFQIAVHHNSEDGIVHDVGVKDHNEPS